MFRDIALTLLVIGLLTIAVLLVGVEEIEGSARVVDGDTLEIGGERIRIVGIDAFEYDQMCGTLACGKAAGEALRVLVRGARVSCSAEGADRYARTLATCRANGEDLGFVLVERGLAVSRAAAYDGAEAKARRGRHGAWAHSFDDPAAFRQHASAVGTSPFADAMEWFRDRLAGRNGR